jgi:hypothetical protein
MATLFFKLARTESQIAFEHHHPRGRLKLKCKQVRKESSEKKVGRNEDEASRL